DVLPELPHELLEIRLRIRVEECLADGLLELLAAAVLAQDYVQLAHDQPEELDLLVENVQDVLLDGAGRREVDDVRLAGLADAVDTANALLDHHRVPRQLVVHESVAELQVETLGTGACGDEHAARLALEARQPL